MDADLARQLRDEAFHLRVLTSELRNRSKTLTRAYDDALARIDQLIALIPTPEEAHGHDRPPAQEEQAAAR